MSKNTITCSMRSLKAASLIPNPREPRYYINGVCIQATATRTRLMATNGAMGLIIDEERNNLLKRPFVEIILPLDVINTYKVNDRNEFNLTISFDNSPLKPSLTYEGRTLTIDAIDGSFPQIPAIIPAAAEASIDTDVKIIFEVGGETREQDASFSLSWLPPLSDRYVHKLSRALRLWAGVPEAKGRPPFLIPSLEEGKVLVHPPMKVSGQKALGLLLCLKDKAEAPNVSWAQQSLKALVVSGATS